MTNEQSIVERVRAQLEASGLIDWYINELNGTVGFAVRGHEDAEMPFSLILAVSPEALERIVRITREDLE